MEVPYPREYHADTSHLVQLLQKGHHGVELDAEAWDRIITWIDLNAPFHGNWRDIIADDNPELVRHQFERRHEMRRRYAGTDSLLDDDPKVEYPAAVLSNSYGSRERIGSRERNEVKRPDQTDGSPQPDPVTALRSIPGFHDGFHEIITLSLGDGVDLELAYIPMTTEKPFFMATTEITNEQFAKFDPAHDSRIEPGDFILFSPGEKGWSVSHPTQPVVRVSWNRAVAFCEWLSQKTGKKVTLPTEAQWEYAASAGSSTPFWYGTLDTDFSPYANLSDISNHRINDFGWSGRRDSLPAWRPADTRFNDHSKVSASVGSYAPNAFGLFDMHGNVSEWVADAPPDKPNHRLVKGGSWNDPPHRARTAFKQQYLAEQQVFDVGFRVIVLVE